LALATSLKFSLIARRRWVVSTSGSKPTSRRLSTSLMSPEEIREVSSWMASMAVAPMIRLESPLLVPWRRTRVATSSSR
jgi:hypothetical protein